jgi:hypothetical protein
LIERVVRNDEVVGLIPICSTTSLSEAERKVPSMASAQEGHDPRRPHPGLLSRCWGPVRAMQAPSRPAHFDRSCEDADDTQQPAKNVGQNPNAPPHRATTIPAKTSDRAETPQRPDPNCIEGEYYQPVLSGLGVGPTQIMAQRHQSASGENEQRTFQGIDGSDQNAGTTHHDQDSGQSLHSFCTIHSGK